VFAAALRDMEDYSAFASLRYLVFGGEAIDWQYLHGLLESSSFQARIINSYGPTECSDVVSTHEYRQLDLSDAGSMRGQLIGEALPHSHLVKLNAFGRLLPASLPGELYIHNRQPALGYIGHARDQGLNELSFSELAYEQDTWLYASGDRSRLRKLDGQLVFEYLGRKDQQVKVNGIRIELAEVEFILDRLFPGQQKRVLAHRNQLLAFIKSNEKQLDNTALRARLLAEVPAYLVPQQFIALKKWPLTVNGKIDLPQLYQLAEQYIASEHLPTANAIEETLHKIWSALLGVKQLGVEDDFFLIGGNSIIATQILSRIQRHFSV